MKAYEFPAWITNAGDIQLPEIARHRLPGQRRVRVLILVNEEEIDGDPLYHSAESVRTWQSPPQIPYDGI